MVRIVQNLAERRNAVGNPTWRKATEGVIEHGKWWSEE
ncbi:hypothetical protein M2251_005476 [Rhodococcus erythropolis]|nr:hypothetical protein [Rhodococcus erythropolis]